MNKNFNHIYKLFSQQNFQSYSAIIEECNGILKHNSNNAVAYYFRGMAKFGIALLVKFDNKLLLQAIPLGISTLGTSSTTATQGAKLNRKMKELSSKLIIADSALEDYNKALLLDTNIVKNMKTITIDTHSDFVGKTFSFSRPIGAKDLEDLLAGNTKYSNPYFIISMIFWFILPFIICYFCGDESGNPSNFGILTELVYTTGLVLYVLFANNTNRNILKKYGSDIHIQYSNKNTSWSDAK